MESRCCSSAAMAAACSVSVSLASEPSCFLSLCMLFSCRFKSDACRGRQRHSQRSAPTDKPGC